MINGFDRGSLAVPPEGENKIRELFPETESAALWSISAMALWKLIRYLDLLFDEVQLLSIGGHAALIIDSSGRISRSANRCFAAWGKQTPCGSCVVRRAFSKGECASKLETMDGELYLVKAICLEVDGMPCALEMANRIPANLSGEDVEKSALARMDMQQNARSYIDPTTGMYNFRYYEDQLSTLDSVTAMAMVCLNNFGAIRENLGCLMADHVLREAGACIASCVRQSDAVIHYDGERFLLVFRSIPKDAMSNKLKMIQQRLESLQVEGCPELKLQAWIGGKYGPDHPSTMLISAEQMAHAAQTSGVGVIVE